jgi:cobalamin-dependent methionine synthase I
MFAEVDRDAFGAIYVGEGRNAAETPLAGIFPRADRLALFAVTLGHDVGRMIGELFAAREFAVGSVLDAAASTATERAGDAVERRFMERCGALRRGAASLRYSPGYCGWDMTGQRTLFAALRPGEIGIALRESCLMEPLKSMSGVIVAGPAAIHEFDDAYEFCADCRTRGCRDRIRRAVVT